MPLILNIDDYDLEEFSELASLFKPVRYGYVVTPNVDHLIRYCEDERFREIYAAAAYILLDSRFLAHLLAILRRQRIRVCPGSDLTPRLLRQCNLPDKRVVVVGGTAAQAQSLSRQFGLSALVHIDPPMGFIGRPQQLEQCLTEIEAASPFCYCLLAVGSPQQEILAHQLQLRDRARGLALCVGGSVNFLTGVERRAPSAMQQLGFEWLFRMLQDPRRLLWRYLVRGPRIFSALRHLKIVLRRTHDRLEPLPGVVAMARRTGQRGS